MGKLLFADDTRREAATDYTETNKVLLDPKRFDAVSEVQSEIMKQLLEGSV